jgi:hypothetical protein
MGGALGAVFVKAGHRVMFSSRHPDTLKGRVEELGPLARVGTVAEAVEFGDVVMVVVPYTAMEQIGKDYGNALAKKVLVIDVSNPIARRDGAEIVKWVDDQGGAGLATAKFLSGAHIGRLAPAGRTRRSSDRRRRPARYRYRVEPHPRDWFRPRRHRRTGDGQISGSRNASWRGAYSGGNPADRNEPPLSGRPE